MVAKKTVPNSKHPPQGTRTNPIRKPSQRIASRHMPIAAENPAGLDRPQRSQVQVGTPAGEQSSENSPRSSAISMDDVVADIHTLRDAVDHSNNRLDTVDENIKLLTRSIQEQTTSAIGASVPNRLNTPQNSLPLPTPANQGSYHNTALGFSASGPLLNQGNNPIQFISTNFPWLTMGPTFLEKIISRRMEVKDLVKLLPEEHRPSIKGRSPLGLPSGFHIDAATEKATIVRETSTTFEEEFPNIGTLIYALSVYGAIRDVFDTERVGFVPAIFAYIRNLTMWYNNDNFDWESIRSYFIAHFRKHQTATDPKVWSEVDVQLHATYISSYYY